MHKLAWENCVAANTPAARAEPAPSASRARLLVGSERHSGRCWGRAGGAAACPLGVGATSRWMSAGDLLADMACRCSGVGVGPCLERDGRRRQVAVGGAWAFSSLPTSPIGSLSPSAGARGALGRLRVAGMPRHPLQAGLGLPVALRMIVQCCEQLQATPGSPCGRPRLSTVTAAQHAGGDWQERSPGLRHPQRRSEATRPQTRARDAGQARSQGLAPLRRTGGSAG